MSESCPFHDPFEQARRDRGVLPASFDGEPIPMILGYKDVRAAAADPATFSSDAPFRVPIPAEQDVRSVRQLPIETDPPVHTAYRRIVEPFFRRPKQPEYAQRVVTLMAELLADAVQRDQVEIVRGFAVVLQSRALTYLLNVPEREADIWIGWGTHVFRDVAGGEAKGGELDTYLHAQLDRAQARAEPGDDFFSALTQAAHDGRPLTRDEMVGFANLAFAGGRDTIIHAVSSVFAYLAEHPATLQALRDDPKLVTTACEEFVRCVSPLTHIGRVCPVDTDVHGEQVKAGGRVSLCWASANFDASVFESPQEFRPDRKPNPHIAFGSGAHSCLGAAHARLLIRTLLQQLAEQCRSIHLLEARRSYERASVYTRAVGFESLTLRLDRR